MIGIYNLEPKYTNIALEKIHLHYRSHGEKVLDYNPLEHDLYDEIYCSSIFTFTDKSYVTEDMVRGGSGFDITTKLPIEIDIMRPKINIGFTTRGCIRNCPFCIVPQKEGRIRIEGDIYSIWDGKAKKITLLDNNILAAPDHFLRIASQLKEENIKVDFNQGLDCRLLTNDIAQVLRDLRYKEYRFSFDNMLMETDVRRAISILNKHDIKWSMWYVLVGFNTSYTEDLDRINLLKSHKQKAYVQRYNRITNPFYSNLASWVNQQWSLVKWSFEEYLKIRGRYKRVHEFINREE